MIIERTGRWTGPKTWPGVLLLALVVGWSPLWAGDVQNTLEAVGTNLLEQLQQAAGPRGLGRVALLLEADGETIPSSSRVIQVLESMLLNRFNRSLGIEETRLLSAPVRSEAAARARARELGAAWLLRVRLSIAKDELVASGDLLPLEPTFWESLAGVSRRQPARHFFASAALDREVRLTLELGRSPERRANWSLREVMRLDKIVLDVACGQVDGEADDEVVVLVPGAVAVYRWRNDTLMLLARHSLASLPDSREPTRVPSGNLLLADFNDDGRDELFVRSFNKQQGELLSFGGAALRSWRRLAGVPLCLWHRAGRPVMLLGSTEPGSNRLQSRYQLVDINASSGPEGTLAGKPIRLRCYNSATGRDLLAWVDKLGVFHLEEPAAGELWRLEGVGSAFTLLDAGGEQRQLVHSQAVFSGPDRMIVRGTAGELWQGDSLDLLLLSMTRQQCRAGESRGWWLAGRPADGSGSRIFFLTR